MRILSLAVLPLFVAACASTQPPAAAPAPVAAPAPAAAAPAEAKPAPQCWNGDAGQFVAVGTKAAIAGVNVECKLTADGKSAQWMGVKP